jgi:hypothetical protein
VKGIKTQPSKASFLSAPPLSPHDLSAAPPGIEQIGDDLRRVL